MPLNRYINDNRLFLYLVSELQVLEDRLLIWKFKRGSRDAFRRIYAKHVDDLLTLAVNLSRDANAAEDIVQDVFISFVESVERFRLTGSLKGYLATCVANQARDYLRKRQRHKECPVDEAEQTASTTDEPVQLVMRSEELQHLSRALMELPYEQRETIMLRLHSGLKFKTIAKLQEIPIKTVQSRYRYGIDKLRSILNGQVQK